MTAEASSIIDASRAPNALTILESLDGEQGKRYQRHPGGWQKLPGAVNATWWRAHAHRVDDLDSLAALVAREAENPSAVVVRGALLDDVNIEEMRRLINAQDDGTPPTLCDVDRQWVMFDIDKLPAEVVEVDPSDMIRAVETGDTETIADAARSVWHHVMPDEWRGCSFAYRWSSSAGLDGWKTLSLHLWAWLDAPVCGASLKQWSKGRALDEALYTANQPHLTAAPRWLDERGGALPDPLDGLRAGIIKGDLAACPARAVGLLDAAAVEVIEAEQRARRLADIERGRREAAARRAQGSAEGETRLERDRERAYNLAADLAAEYKGGRHTRALGITRQLFGLDLPEHELRAALHSGATGCSLDAKETEDIWKWFSALNLQPDPDRPPPSYARAPRAPQTEKPAQTHAARRADDVENARKKMTQVIEGAARGGGVHLLVTDTGVGKSTTARNVLVPLIEDGRATVRIALPTCDLRSEHALEWRNATSSPVHEAVTRTDDNCTKFDIIAAASRVARDGIQKACRACDLHPRTAGHGTECAYWRARLDRADTSGARVEVTTHASAVIGADDDEVAPNRVGVLIVDEDITGALIHEASVDVGQFARLCAAGDIVMPAEAQQSLQAVMVASEQGQHAGAAALQALVPAWSVRINEESDTAEQALDDALQLNGDACREALRAGVPWMFTAGLAQCLRCDWLGSYVRDGRLIVQYTRRNPLIDSARTVLVLDATAHDLATYALWGVETQIHRLTAPLPESVEVLHVAATGLGSNGHVDDGASARAAAIWEGAHRLFDGPSTLHVTLKKRCDLDTWTGAVLDDLEGEVIHHNGTLARGSNAYTHRCDTVVVDPWHVPRFAIEMRAGALCNMSGGDWSEEREQWLEVAAHQLVNAPVKQAAGRIRARLKKRARVVFLDERDPTALGFPPSEVIDADAVAGLMGYASLRAGGLLARGAVEASGGVLVLGEGASVSVAESVKAQALQVLSGYTERSPVVQYKTYCTSRPCSVEPPAPSRLLQWRQAHPDAWGRILTTARLRETTVALSIGGHAAILLHSRDLPADDLATLARSRGAAWYRLDSGSRVYLAGESPEDRLRAALVPALAQVDVAAQSLTRLRALIAEHAGFSVSKVRDMLRASRHDGENDADVIRRMLLDAEDEETAFVIEERAAIMEFHGGIPREDATAYALAAYVRAMLTRGGSLGRWRESRQPYRAEPTAHPPGCTTSPLMTVGA